MNSHQIPYPQSLYFMMTPLFFSAWVILIVLSYYCFDKPIALYFYKYHQDFPWILAFSQNFTFIGNAKFSALTTFLLLLWSYFALKSKTLSRLFLFLFLTITLSGLICDTLKIVCGRSRPMGWFHYHLYGFYLWQFKNSMWSFPSGHATTISGFMSGLCFLFPCYEYLFITIAILVGLSRVILLAHFLSDVMAGFYLGIIITIALLGWIDHAVQRLHLNPCGTDDASF